MNVFDPQAFANPGAEFRPLQIVHGLDRFLLDPENLAGEQGIDQRLRTAQATWASAASSPTSASGTTWSATAQWDIYRYGMRKADELGLAAVAVRREGLPQRHGRRHRHPLAPRVRRRSAWPATRPAVARPGRGALRPARELPALRVGRRHGRPAHAPRATSVWDLSALVDAQGTLRWQAPAGDWTLLYLAERVMYEGTHASRQRVRLQAVHQPAQPGGGGRVSARHARALRPRDAARAVEAKSAPSSPTSRR